MGLHRKNAWQRLTPNEQHDWINLRDPVFDNFIALNDEPLSVFADRQPGIETSRDPWVYNFSQAVMAQNIQSMIAFYNEQVDLQRSACKAAGARSSTVAADLIDTDEKRIKWTRSPVANLCRQRKGTFRSDHMGESVYRPFAKSWIFL